MKAVDLLGLLEQAGITGLRETPKEIFGRCPGHFKRLGHEDNRPSWSINKVTGKHNCFSCHYSGTLTQLLIDITGAAPEDLEQSLQQQSFLRTMEGIRAEPEAHVEPILTEWILRNALDDPPERLLDLRRLKRWAVDRLQVRWERDNKRWVLPLRNAQGTLLGAQYRQKGVVLTLPKGLPKAKTLFGYEQALERDYAVVVESPLDAVRLNGLGINSVAALGAWLSREQVTLLARGFTYVVLALDDDDTGHQALDTAIPMLRRAGCPPLLWQYQGLTDEDGRKAKDVGDVASDAALLDAWARTRRFN